MSGRRKGGGRRKRAAEDGRRRRQKGGGEEGRKERNRLTALELLGREREGVLCENGRMV